MQLTALPVSALLLLQLIALPVSALLLLQAAIAALPVSALLLLPCPSLPCYCCRYPDVVALGGEVNPYCIVVGKEEPVPCICARASVCPPCVFPREVWVGRCPLSLVTRVAG